MRLCGLDIETTGFDAEKGFITELAYIIQDWKKPKPIRVYSQLVYDDWDPSIMSQEVQDLTKIDFQTLKDYGESTVAVLEQLNYDLQFFGVDYIVAHFGRGFDRPFIKKALERFDPEARLKNTVLDTPWLCTKEDIVYSSDFTSHRLMHVAAQLGFLNPFPHSALFDVATTLRVLEHFDLAQVIERSKIPWVIVAAGVEFKTKDLAKARKYSWETIGSDVFPKEWVKKVKKNEIEKERAEAPFPIKILKDPYGD